MSWVDIEMVLDLLKTDESIKETANPIEAHVNKGQIEFVNVCFTYDNEKPVE